MAPDQLIITNPAKEILKKGGPVTGMNVFESLRPSVIKIAAQTGYDMILVVCIAKSPSVEVSAKASRPVTWPAGAGRW